MIYFHWVMVSWEKTSLLDFNIDTGESAPIKQMAR